LHFYFNLYILTQTRCPPTTAVCITISVHKSRARQKWVLSWFFHFFYIIKIFNLFCLRKYIHSYMYLKCRSKCLYFTFKTCHLSINVNVVCATTSRKLQNLRVTVVTNNAFYFTGTQNMNLKTSCLYLLGQKCLHLTF